jgi:FkbM family methyltransferase
LVFQDLKQFALAIWADESNRGQRLRRLVTAGGWQGWKRIAQKPLTTRLFNGKLFRAYPDCVTSSGAFYFRIPNSKPIEFMRSHIAGGTLVDVGANVGLVSLLFADKLNHALLFEPNPTAALRARENIKLNRLDFEVHQMALSDQTGSVQFENRGGVSAVNRTVSGFDATFPTIEVSCSTFDDFLKSHKQPRDQPWYVKIDVEGHENSVLRGMQNFLQNQRPRLVMFEYLQRTDLQETFRIFDSVGYRVIVLNDDGKPKWAEPTVAPLQDLFACPKELGPQLVPEPTSRRSSD